MTYSRRCCVLLAKDLVLHNLSSGLFAADTNKAVFHAQSNSRCIYLRDSL
jgi:hypothetical protein